MKKVAMLAATAILACSAIAAEDSWYVCLGSFKKQSNADNYVVYLAKNNVTARIVDVNLSGTVMHRVVQSTGYGKNADSYDRRSKLQKEWFIQKLGINDLWVCKGSESKQARDGAGAAPIDSDVKRELWLEPADPKPAAAFRDVPVWTAKAVDDDQEFRFNPDGDFEIVTDRGFGNITVTRYEFRR